MNEHENETRMPDPARDLPRQKSVCGTAPRKEGDLVVDLSGIEELDLASLALLLTAQQKAAKENRKVWLVGVPLKVWNALNTMGLGKFFFPFPESGEVAV